MNSVSIILLLIILPGAVRVLTTLASILVAVVAHTIAQTLSASVARSSRALAAARPLEERNPWDAPSKAERKLMRRSMHASLDLLCLRSLFPSVVKGSAHVQ